MSKTVQLNLESWKYFTDEELQLFFNSYISHINKLVLIDKTIYVKYFTEQGIEEILSDIHILSGFFKQDCIAYKIDDKYNCIQGIAGIKIDEWKPFKEEFFLDVNNNYHDKFIRELA